MLFKTAYVYIYFLSLVVIKTVSNVNCLNVFLVDIKL